MIGVVLAVVILCCGGGTLWIGLQARVEQTPYPGGTTGTARVVSVAEEITEPTATCWVFAFRRTAIEFYEAIELLTGPDCALTASAAEAHTRRPAASAMN